MIIYVFGKSGSGKTYLSEKLASDLPNSIHISLDELNKDLMKLDKVIEFANNLFSTNKKSIDSKFVLEEIKSDKTKYAAWNSYMIDVCTNFLTNYMGTTDFDYYILDHINAGILNLSGDNIKIECICDDNTRLQRLKERENVNIDTLKFRDENYIKSPCDIYYDNTNYEEILNYATTNKIS